jgi:hypothetical protein
MEQVKFYHDLGKNQISKPWNKLMIYCGFGLIGIGIWGIISENLDAPGEFILNFSFAVNIVNGILFYLLGSGRLFKSGKYFVKITDSAISYKLNDGGTGNIPFTAIKDLEFAKSYIEFTLRSGKQIRLTHNTLPYFVIRAVKDELEPVREKLAENQAQ